jgi:hypothetical protein
MRNVLKVQKKIKPAQMFSPCTVKPTILIAPKWLEALSVNAGDFVIFEIVEDEIGARLVITAEIPF